MARPIDPRTLPAIAAAARSLFYRRGLAATTVADIAQASGLTKPTVYRHFASKVDLIEAYLDNRIEDLDIELREWLSKAKPEARAVAIIDWLASWLARPTFLGCAFLRARAELPDDDVVRRKTRARKAMLRDTIRTACRDAGAADPDALAWHLLLIVEGATSIAFGTGDVTAAIVASRKAARVALAASGLEPE